MTAYRKRFWVRRNPQGFTFGARGVVSASMFCFSVAPYVRRFFSRLKKDRKYHFTLVGYRKFHSDCLMVWYSNFRSGFVVDHQGSGRVMKGTCLIPCNAFWGLLFKDPSFNKNDEVFYVKITK